MTELQQVLKVTTELSQTLQVWLTSGLPDDLGSLYADVILLWLSTNRNKKEKERDSNLKWKQRLSNRKRKKKERDSNYKENKDGQKERRKRNKETENKLITQIDMAIAERSRVSVH